MRIFTRNPLNPKYKFLSTFDKLEMLQSDMQKLRKKHKKNKELVDTIDAIDVIVNADINVMKSKPNEDIENEIKKFIKETRNNFAKFELSLVLQPNNISS